MNLGNMQSSDQREWADAKRDELYNMLCGIDLTGERYLTLATILSTFTQADSSRAVAQDETARHRGLRLVSTVNR
jgi:hypothetical protein